MLPPPLQAGSNAHDSGRSDCEDKFERRESPSFRVFGRVDVVVKQCSALRWGAWNQIWPELQDLRAHQAGQGGNARIQRAFRRMGSGAPGRYSVGTPVSATASAGSAGWSRPARTPPGSPPATWCGATSTVAVPRRRPHPGHHPAGWRPPGRARTGAVTATSPRVLRERMWWPTENAGRAAEVDEGCVPALSAIAVCT